MQFLIRFFAILMLGIFPFCSVQAEEFSRNRLQIETEGGTYAFNVELAGTDKQRAKGLMYRKTLPEGTGMLFDYGSPRRVSMWMKNTLIPLDMLFIRPDGTIEKIRERTIPHSLDPISSQGEVRAVLELGGGVSEKLGISVGDRVLHPIFGTEQ